MKYPLYILEVLLITMTSQIAYAVAPTAGEMRESRQWVSAKFGGAPDARTPDARMIVLSNNDPAQKNSRNGKPMKIGNAEYSSGLFCHAVSDVTVTLPAPGKAFVATVGVDSNEQTSGGRGSVEFIVEAGGKVLFRSGIMREGIPGLPLKIDLGGVRRTDIDYAALRRLIKQWREQISPNYYGDYYPLTKFSAESNDWMAWQFDRPEAGEGMAQFFRRDASPYESARFRLQALDPNGVYEVTSIDSKAKRRISGKELVSEGLRINMPKRPEALVFLYRKL